MCVCIVIYLYITTSYAFLFGNVIKYQLIDETFKVWLYFSLYIYICI